ncbi:NYN domain-containing protein [Phellopilus nigrolimitatus]|nr:NYN domain-containing protein [Phellopilus nigrolimitatus]
MSAEHRSDTTKPVGIFWDYENCHPPSNMSGYEVARVIRQAVQSLQVGPISVFKAYMDVVLEGSKPKQVELQQSVTISHTPHNSKKEVADKAIITDFLVFALERQGPSIIVLITGDGDFNYALSVLRMRGHEVVIILPPRAHRSLQHQASIILDWSRLICQPSNSDPGVTSTKRKRSPEEDTPRVAKKARKILSSRLCSKDSVLADGGRFSHSGHRSSDLTLGITSAGPSVAVKTAIRMLTPEQTDNIIHREVVPSNGGLDSLENSQTLSTASGSRLLASEDSDLSKPSKQLSSVGSLEKAIVKTAEGAWTVLIKVLREERTRGRMSVPIISLGFLLLKADVNVYHNAGSNGIKDYLKSAQAATVICLFNVNWNWAACKGYARLCDHLTGAVPSHPNDLSTLVPPASSAHVRGSAPVLMPLKSHATLGNSATPLSATPLPMVDHLIKVLRELRDGGRMPIKRSELLPELHRRYPGIYSGFPTLKAYLREAQLRGIITIVKTGRGEQTCLDLDPALG